MKIVYTKHALGKFKSLSLLGWKFTKEDIKQALLNPDYSTVDNEHNIRVNLRKLDKRHNLRVIYKKNYDIITVITFYPREKERL